MGAIKALRRTDVCPASGIAQGHDEQHGKMGFVFLSPVEPYFRSGAGIAVTAAAGGAGVEGAAGVNSEGERGEFHAC